jgi:trimethylamine--corrinoid protein Co-methyltransferase
MIESPKIGLFEVFSSDELYKIHIATLEVLENIGVCVDNEDALHLLSNIGANVDEKTRIVKIPQNLVEEAVRKSPRTVLFAGRDSKYNMSLNGKRVHFGLGGGAISVLSSETNLCRPSTKKDVVDASRLADALSNIDFVMSLFTSQDVPQPVLALHDLHAMLTNTVKPVMVVDYGLDAKYLIRMAGAIVGGIENLVDRPILGMYSEPVSPLTHGKSQVANLMSFAKAKLPIAYIPSPASCSTAPATLAGAIVQANAETLSGNVIAQFTSEGARFIYGSNTLILDMKTAVFPYGAPEFMLTNLAMAQLGRYYNLPIWSTGGCSDSKILDGQAMMEAALTLLIAAQSGANLIHDVGSFLNFGLTGCLELVTICDELISMISYILGGIEVTDETLAIDVMKIVGPGGHFLSQKHTLKHFKKEHWFPSLIDRQMRETWLKKGSKDLLQRAREKTREILATHSPEPLPKDVQKELDLILRKAEVEIIKK